MKRKFRQRWSTITPLSTKRTITKFQIIEHLKKTHCIWRWKSKSDLGQAHTCGGVKLVNQNPKLPSLNYSCFFTRHSLWHVNCKKEPKKRNIPGICPEIMETLNIFIAGSVICCGGNIGWIILPCVFAFFLQQEYIKLFSIPLFSFDKYRNIYILTY
jgi:hypothetical protein